MSIRAIDSTQNLHARENTELVPTREPESWQRTSHSANRWALIFFLVLLVERANAQESKGDQGGGVSFLGWGLLLAVVFIGGSACATHLQSHGAASLAISDPITCSRILRGDDHDYDV
jgi:hypothetical protein